MFDSIVRQRFRARWLVDDLCGRCRARLDEGPRDRGDVPGWVMVTIMTAGLVVALWAIAGPKLGDMFSNALQQVTGGPK